MSLDTELTDERFMDLESKLDRIPSYIEYNNEYNSSLTKEEFKKYVNLNWVWLTDKYKFYTSKGERFNLSWESEHNEYVAWKRKIEEEERIYWSDFNNVKRAVIWARKKAGSRNESISGSILEGYNLGGLIYKYKGDFRKLFYDVFPDDKMLKEKPWTVFRITYLKYWENNEKERIEAIKWLREKAKEEGVLISSDYFKKCLRSLYNYYYKVAEKEFPKQEDEECSRYNTKASLRLTQALLKGFEEAYPDDDVIKKIPFTILEFTGSYWWSSENRYKAFKNYFLNGGNKIVSNKESPWINKLVDPEISKGLLRYPTYDFLFKKEFLWDYNTYELKELKFSKIKQLRVDKRMSRKAFSEKAGISREELLFIELEKEEPSITLAKKIAKELNTTVEELF